MDPLLDPIRQIAEVLHQHAGLSGLPDPLQALIRRGLVFWVLPAVVLSLAARLGLGRPRRYAFAVAWTLVTGVLAVGVYARLWEVPLPTSRASLPACIINLRLIDGAKEQWALETHKSSGDLPDVGGINVYLKNTQTPVCPAGGLYSYKQVGVLPTCSIGTVGHSLDPSLPPHAKFSDWTRSWNLRCLGQYGLVVLLPAVAFPWARARRSRRAGPNPEARD